VGQEAHQGQKHGQGQGAHPGQGMEGRGTGAPGAEQKACREAVLVRAHSVHTARRINPSFSPPFLSPHVCGSSRPPPELPRPSLTVDVAHTARGLASCRGGPCPQAAERDGQRGVVVKRGRAERGRERGKKREGHIPLEGSPGVPMWVALSQGQAGASQVAGSDRRQ